MQMREKNPKRGVLVRGMLYLLLALTLVVSMNAPLIPGVYLNAFASEEGEDPGTEPPIIEPPVVTPKVAGVAIYWKGGNAALGYSNSSNETIQGTISAVGGVLEFDSVITWDTWDENRNHYLIHWSVDNNAVATITDTGILTAHSDGVVRVYATVYGADTQPGTDLSAYACIEVNTSAHARYVTSIQIADEANTIMDDYFNWSPTLATDTKQFHAVVTVYDPATTITETYSTINGPLSAQASDISDIVWYVGDDSMGTVLETGEFKPEHYGGVQVYAVSNSGEEGGSLSDSVYVQSYNPAPGDTQGSGHNPQDTLTIRVYYSEYTPAEYGEEAYVIQETYTVDEIEAMGTMMATYTALGGTKGYFTMTGRGVPFSALLQNAGVNMDKAVSFDLHSVDGSKQVSKSFVFMDRYYFPNIDLGSGMERYWEPVQVFPILALESNQREGINALPDENMQNSTRFRLLFGAVIDVGNSEFQRKWIHTIDVIYLGKPAIEEDGGGGGGIGEGDGDGTGGTGDGNGDGSSGSGNASATGVGMGPATDGSVDPSVSGGIEGAQSEGSADADAGSDTNAHNPGAYSVYQVMSSFDNAGEISLDFGNPIKQFVAPVGATVFFAGCIEMLLWYRRQTQQAGHQIMVA